jgi:signal transduction histidine kinase
VNREEALALLSSGSTHLRRTAARVLARDAQESDLVALRAARSGEVDSYARGSLDRAIAKLTDAGSAINPDVATEADDVERSKREIQARATEWIAGLLLHELASPIGLLAYTASREVPDFENSRTKGHIATLQMVFAAIEQLRKASATPRPAELDLAGFIGNLVETEFADSRGLITMHGPQPMLLVSDEALLRFAICNGLRNAVEAIGDGVHADAPPIVITWGATDTDYWVAVLDRGPGIPASIDSIFGIGKTTKKGHSGFGLPIALSAIEALGGTVTLQPASGGGTKYELRWER